MPWIVVGDLDARSADVVQLMKLGAVDILRPSASAEEIVRAVQAAMPNETRQEGRPEREARRRLTALTARERDVLKGLLAGGTNKSIAKDLSLSPRTVETYRAKLMDALGAKSLAELLQFAAQASLD